MMENNDDRLVNEIKEGLDFLDSKIEVRTPDMNHFRELVANVEEKKRIRSRREFLAFILVALTILGSVAFAYYKYSVIFLAVQMLSVLLIPFAVFIWNRRQRRQVTE